ncbi:MAG: ABC transporter ATP-binding protein [Candidatus Methanofastidiosia archaeon]|jgi:ABC-2 type transport system ATP-binding protein
MVLDTADHAIVARGVIKTFKKKSKRKYLIGPKIKKDETIFAVHGVDLSVKNGELFGLLGPNGAGKTTLVKCLSTLLLPNQGTAYICGNNIIENPIAARECLGITTGGERTLYWKLSGKDNLRYFAALYGLSPEEADERIDYLLTIMGLKDRQDERIEKYSTGMRQKISICRSLLHDPPVLLLDEPTLGLDPSFSRFIRSFIKDDLNKKRGKTILLTTHYMDEADQLCDRIAIMNQGKIVAVDTPENLKKAIPHQEVLEVTYMGPANFEHIGQSVYTQSEDGRTVSRIHAEQVEEIMSSVIEEASSTKTKILSMHVTKPTLEDVFIHLTGAQLTGESNEE